MHYFKGVHNREIEFGEHETITVKGPNGSGKSTIMDAFFWCLWGKNAAGQSDQKFLIKTVDMDGQEIPHVDHEVELVLVVNGEAQTFRRVLTPKYDKDDELKGNVTSYFWNDVPLKQSEYNAKVAAIISEDVFKLTTSPYAFLSLEWQKQREVLIRMAGDVSDADVAKDNDVFEDLIAKLNGKRIDELKREAEAKLKRVNDTMKDIPARIDEVQRNKPEAPDLEAIAERRRLMNEELAAIEKQEHDDAEMINARNADRNALLKQVNELRWKQQQILNAKEAEERNAIHKANQTYLNAETEYKLIESQEKSDAANCGAQDHSINLQISTKQREVEAYEKQLADLRVEWQTVSAQMFKADDYLKCPLYGHNCMDGTACAHYDQNQGAAFDKWDADKKQKLADIQQRGQTLKQQLASVNAEVEGLKQQLVLLKDGYSKRNSDRLLRAGVLSTTMQQNPKRPLIATVKGEDIPEWVELDRQVKELEQTLGGMHEVEAVNTTSAEAKKRIHDALERYKVEESAIDAIGKADRRIAELESELKDLGEQKAELEYLLTVIRDFEIEKTNLISGKVNQMFHIVRWQMFQRQVNGDEIPCCMCLVNGVRWNDANTAAQLNAGIDVASTLASAYGVSAPMFIDGAERSGHIYNPHTSQRILLRFEKGVTEMKIEV